MSKKQDDSFSLKNALAGPRDRGELSMEELDEASKVFERPILAKQTQRAYGHAWNKFKRWCQEKNIEPLKARPIDVKRYLTFRALTLSWSAIALDVHAMRYEFASAELPDPTREDEVKKVLSGIREKIKRPPKRAAAITLKELHAAIEHMKGTSNKILRNKAFLLVGFAAALRRSEITDIDIEHLKRVGEDYRLLIPRSKTDQKGEGVFIPIYAGEDEKYCPVRALDTWIEAARIESGALFPSFWKGGQPKPGSRVTARTIDRAVRKWIGPHCEEPEKISAHSLRAGWITEAAKQGVPEHEIRAHSRHKTLRIMLEYIRDTRVFKDSTRRVMG